MAMYKDSDITATMIQENFPEVAASIAQSMNAGADALSVDSLKISHPHIATALMDEGRMGAVTQTDDAIKAEQTRILAILALNSVGCESVIQEALADASMSVDSVKVKLFDAMQANTSAHFEAHKKEGETLGTQLSSLGSGESESSESDEEKALNAMANAGKIARGE